MMWCGAVRCGVVWYVVCVVWCGMWCVLWGGLWCGVVGAKSTSYRDELGEDVDPSENEYKYKGDCPEDNIGQLFDGRRYVVSVPQGIRQVLPLGINIDNPFHKVFLYNNTYKERLEG